MDNPSSTPLWQRGLPTGPIILIVLGLMFLMEEFVPHWGFRRTWPILLVVIGVLKLFDSMQPPRPPEGPRI